MQSKNRDRDPASLERAANGRRWVVQGYMIFRPNSQFTPPTDVMETDDRLIVLVEIAGMRSSDFSVSLLNQQHLVISGTRERPPFAGAAYHQVEIGYGEFRIELMLPFPIDQDQVSATYRDGFLVVELPRQPEKHIHVVDVQQPEEDTDSND